MTKNNLRMYVALKSQFVNGKKTTLDKTCLPPILKILLISLVAPEQMSFGFRRSLIFFASEKSRFARQNIFSWDSREGDLSQFYSLLI